MNTKLNQWWGVQSTRINALSLRERAFLFLSVIACCLALVDTVWLSPAQLAHKQVKQQFDQQNTDLLRARAALKTMASPVNAMSALRDESQALSVRLEAVNQQIKEVVPLSTDTATPLPQVLVHFLSRHEGLTLVRVTVAAPEIPVAKAPQAASPVAPAAALLTRQGVELTVSGSYPELVKYVQTLERALPHVRWGIMTLKSEKLPPELTLELFLVGVPA